MPVTVVTAPDGTEYEVSHPDTATDEEILAYASNNLWRDS